MNNQALPNPGLDPVGMQPDRLNHTLHGRKNKELSFCPKKEKETGHAALPSLRAVSYHWFRSLPAQKSVLHKLEI